MIEAVRLTVSPGELFMTAFNRPVEPTSGELRVDGRNVTATDDAELRKLRGAGSTITPATTPHGVRGGTPPGWER